MAKVKRISINAFEKVMKSVYTPVEVKEWNGIEVNINKTLSLKDTLEFVDSVVKSCFEKDTNSYIPEVKDFVIRVCVLEKYANFTMPRSAEAKYDFVYRTDAVDFVLKHINSAQYIEICKAIDSKIDNINRENVEAFHRQMSELCDTFENMQSQFGSIFSDVTKEDVKAITDAVIGGTIDEDKLVSAYAKTQVHNVTE